ncbi:unnamed protein product [Camellia sinensis]
MVHPRRVEEGFGHTPLDIEMYHDHDSYHHKNEEARIDDVDHGMDNKKEKTIITQDDQTVEEGKKDEQPPLGTIIKPKSKRVATLDAFRGLTIVVMTLVDDAGEAYPRIDRSPWNGCTLADFVLSFFLFIVGVAISFALKLEGTPLHGTKVDVVNGVLSCFRSIDSSDSWIKIILEAGEAKGESGFILDGFPRTIRQASGPYFSLITQTAVDLWILLSLQ